MTDYAPDTDDDQHLTNHFYTKDYTAKCPGLTLKLAKEIGDKLGVDWDIVDLGQFTQGIKEEMEHGSMYGEISQVHNDDYEVSAKIVLAHLYERPDYYTALEQLEQAGDAKFDDDEALKKKWVADQRAAHQAAWDSVSS